MMREREDDERGREERREGGGSGGGGGKSGARWRPKVQENGERRPKEGRGILLYQ